MCCDYLVKKWLRAEPTVFQQTLSISNSQTKILSPDPMRFAVTVTTSAGTSVFLSTSSVNRTWPFEVISGGQNSIAMDEDTYGQLIQESIWSWIGTGTPAIYVTALSYNPQKFEVYREYVRKWLSNQVAP